MQVGGMVDTPLTMTTTTWSMDWCPLGCGDFGMRGNRRAELLQVRPIPGKNPWVHGAILTAEWRGTRLADVLEAAGVLTATTTCTLRSALPT